MLIGKRISGRYKILEMIGGGGMSNVYLAHDMILDRDVAIKVLRYDLASEDELHRRFQREALSATSLTHSNIVTIYDVGDDENIHYIVMEYVKGQTLKQYIINHAPISSERSVAIMKQLTSAIAHAHQNQIIHRDIKPQNILLDEEGNVKVTDFGIAMALTATSFTQTNSVLGTVHYLSPEQARGGTASKKSDIYALGIVLYELLTGELPFSGESAVSIALKHLQAETPSVRKNSPFVPQSLENVVLKATAKEPMYRYRSAEEMLNDLNSVLLPERVNEKKFTIPSDEFATKAIPTIKTSVPYTQYQETKVIEPINVTPNSNGEKKKRKKWPWIVGSIFAVLLLTLATVIAFPGIFGPKKVDVPDVTDRELSEARQMIEDAGFIITEENEEPSEEIAKDRVTRTIPEAGKSRDKGSEITIYISTGKETILMADYTEWTIDQIDSNLKNLFKDVETNYVFDNQAPVGTVLAQEPKPDTEVIPEETTVILTISNGRDLVTVADFKNFTEDQLNEYKELNVRIKEEHHDTIPAGSVISQSVEKGKEVERGSSIEVVVSKGPEARPVKYYIQTVFIPYDPIEEGAEQVVQIFIQDNKNKIEEPNEVFTITQDTSKRITLELADGQNAVYRVVRDLIPIIEETISYDSTE